MAAATADRDPRRQPGELIHYTGASGYTYYKGTLLIKEMANGRVVPATTAGASNSVFLGVVDNRVDLSAGLGSSQEIINVWATGEFTFAANGTGASAHIGQQAFVIDNQTVGTSSTVPSMRVGLITGIPSTSEYRVLINSAVGTRGVSVHVNNA